MGGMDLGLILKYRPYSRGLRPCGGCEACCSADMNPRTARKPQQCDSWSDAAYIVSQQVPEWYAPERR